MGHSWPGWFARSRTDRSQSDTLGYKASPCTVQKLNPEGTVRAQFGPDGRQRAEMLCAFTVWIRNVGLDLQGPGAQVCRRRDGRDFGSNGIRQSGMPGLRDAIGVAVWRIHPQTVRPADPCWLSPASLLRPSVLLHAPALPKVHFQRTVSTTDWAPILSQGGSVRSPGARGGNRVGRQPRTRILARATGVSRQTIRKVLRDQRHGTFRTRQSSLDARSVTLEAAWSGCCRIGAELWRWLKASGFGGSLRVKRQMYGRAMIDLRQARGMGPAGPKLHEI